jgi:hypothetical protein
MVDEQESSSWGRRRRCGGDGEENLPDGHVLRAGPLERVRSVAALRRRRCIYGLRLRSRRRCGVSPGLDVTGVVGGEGGGQGLLTACCCAGWPRRRALRLLVHPGQRSGAADRGGDGGWADLDGTQACWTHPSSIRCRWVDGRHVGRGGGAGMVRRHPPMGRPPARWSGTTPAARRWCLHWRFRVPPVTT